MENGRAVVVDGRRRWAAPGEPQAFEAEVASALEINARWIKDEADGGGAWTADLDGMRGWVTPLWGALGDFLYLRRPEGIWKTRLPVGANACALSLGIESKKSGQVVPVGFERGLGGWFDVFGGEVNLQELDDAQSAARFGCPVEATLGAPLCDIARDLSHSSKLTMDVREDACRAPRFEQVGDWLVAHDSADGARVAYPLAQWPAAKAALALGQLWFRYSGPCFEPFTVQVRA